MANGKADGACCKYWGSNAGTVPFTTVTQDYACYIQSDGTTVKHFNGAKTEITGLEYTLSEAQKVLSYLWVQCGRNYTLIDRVRVYNSIDVTQVA